MADGMNNIRAMRVTELMGDYRNLQTYMAGIRASPSAEEYNEDGYVVLRQCVAQSQALLQQPFQSEAAQRGDEEQNKAQLRRIIVDAAVRRFQAKRLYMRATAALRWVNARTTILQGQRPHAGHAPALQQIRNQLRSELATITDARVDASLRQADTAEGKWLAEDPPLATIQRVAGNGNGR
ncbi:hypothetical protein PRZ48_004698 [Zasmidium cellare]|uniref:Uncharacterized protein n=1 Tax=Zasmidium cellare TaxID=395010 RepID=A0ABR0ESG7_ZASCE|nr:hypothetical protein PRZ48_004698 [Zasmidium cellare]